MKKLFIFAIATILIIGCNSNAETTQESNSTQDSTENLALVETQKFHLQNFKHYITVHGVVQTENMAMVNAEAQGKIDQILISEGQEVAKGQTLAIINGDIIKKNIAELENRLNLAQTVFERQERLWNQNIGSEIQYLQAKTERDALQKSLQTAQEQLSKTLIKAPFSGTIDEVFPKQGEYTAPGSPFFRLINLNDVYIKADVSENYLNNIAEGDSVWVTIPNLNNTEFKSVISRIGDFINPANRTFKIRLNIKNSNQVLKPNMLAELKINDYTNDSVMVLPDNIIMRGAQNKVYVFEANQQSDNLALVEKLNLEIGRSYNNQVEILSGVKPGAQLIVKGARSVQEGEKVNTQSNNAI